MSADASVDAAAPTSDAVARAQEELDAHVREIVAWHFSPETGTPRWLDWARATDFDPSSVTCFDDLLQFPLFDGEALRTEAHERWIPRAYAGRPYYIFETGGTTGMPKQRVSWDDWRIDYEAFSDTLDDDAFPRGGHWLMVGPTGPRRLRLAIEHLAHHRGSACYFVDLDPRWVKKLIGRGAHDEARLYMEHVIDQAVTILQHRSVDVLFTTPRLLETLGDKLSLVDAGVKGVFCGGTEMAPQSVRFLVEEVLEGQVGFVPTYGNTLMGLAACRPLTPADRFSITYHAPQPRAVLRVTTMDGSGELVDYDEWGRVELTTLTRELFLPRFPERDEAVRRKPYALYPWDGVGEVRPFRAEAETIVEGVY